MLFKAKTEITAITFTKGSYTYCFLRDGYETHTFDILIGIF